MYIAFAISFLLGAVWTQASHLQPRQTSSIPDFVTKYAPLVYLDQNDIYMPSDIQAQLNNTYPALNFTALPRDDVPSPLLLSDLEQLNAQGKCMQFGNCPIFLTSKENVTTNPQWLYGVTPDPVTGETVGARSCAVIVNDHGSGLVDAYYMYFYAFNMGPLVMGQVLGNHVGDWEHSMYGQAFTYDALDKNGTRPIIYSAIGSHANFAVTGTQSRKVSVVTVDDFTSVGPLWDPTASAYFYTFTPSSDTNGTFVPSDSATPTEWLFFEGRWGDLQYPDSDPRQVNFLNLNLTYKYETGPTGPLDKDLDRKDVCPAAAARSCTTLTALPVVSGSSIPVTVTRTTSQHSTSALTSQSSSGTSSFPSGTSGSPTGSGSPTATPNLAAGLQSLAPSFSLILSIFITIFIAYS